MENIKVYVVPNTQAIAEDLTPLDFIKTQHIVNSPLVLFMGTEDQEVYGHFWVEAESSEELSLMCKNKVFYTPDLPEREYEWRCGAVFVGVKSRKLRKTVTAMGEAFSRN